MNRVIVVGGGIAGLAAAHTLQKAGCEVTVLEAEPEAGGRMRTERWHGVWVWRAAGFFASTDMDAVEPLVRDLGLLDRRISFRAGDLVFDVWRDGRASPLAVTEPLGFFRYRNIGLRGKLQLLRLAPTIAAQRRRGGDVPYEPWRAAWCDDETVEAWLGRVAPELLEYAIEPTYEVYCSWEPTDVGKGMFAYLTTTYRSTHVHTFPEGLGEVTRALAARLHVETRATVTRVVAGRPARVEWVGDGSPGSAEADAVVVAIPGSRVGGVVEGLDPVRRRFFDRVRYVPKQMCFFKLTHDPGGIPTQVYFPRREDRHLAAAGFSEIVTPSGVPLFQATLKSARIKATADWTDERVLDAIEAECVRRFPALAGVIEDRYLQRWRDALPVFWPGSLAALDEFRKLPPLPGVVFAGDYLAGPSTGAAYTTGQRAAAEILAGESV